MGWDRGWVAALFIFLFIKFLECMECVTLPKVKGHRFITQHSRTDIHILEFSGCMSTTHWQNSCTCIDRLGLWKRPLWLKSKSGITKYCVYVTATVSLFTGLWCTLSPVYMCENLNRMLDKQPVNPRTYVNYTCTIGMSKPWPVACCLKLALCQNFAEPQLAKTAALASLHVYIMGLDRGLVFWKKIFASCE